MTVFIIRPTDHGADVTEWDATPSERKHHRGTGDGFTINAHNEQALRRSLSRYFPEGI